MSLTTALLSLSIGLLCGALLVLGFGRLILAPASARLRRGYFNAFVAGLLLVAAAEVIPNALSAAGLAGHRALSALVFAGEAPAADSVWGMLLQPAQIELAVRGIGAAMVMVLFFRANAVPLLAAAEAGSAAAGRAPVRAGQGAFALPTAGTDRVGLLVIAGGLAGYSLWRGLTAGHFSASAGAVAPGLVVLIVSTSLLGIAAWGLTGSLERQWWIGLVVSLVLGLTAGAGALWSGERPALEVGFVPLLVSAGCLVYGIGRLLRLLQHEIGLGWRTTAAVGVGALVLLQSQLVL